MSSVITSVHKGFMLAGFILLVVVGLVLFPVVALAVRPLLIVGLLLAAVAGVVLARVSPPFREWFRSVGEPQVNYSGLRLATDIAIHPSHSWARISSAGVAVGADDLVQATLGPVEAVELPPLGSRVQQGERLFSLRRGNRCVEVRSPISGTVVTRNEALLERPRLVNEGPFTEGWALRLRPVNIERDRQRLLGGGQARGWFRQEIDRLLATVLCEKAPVPSLPDGGTLAADLHEQISDAAWQRLTETFFAAGPEAK